MRVGFFTECYRPIVNGVVASIDTLRGGLERAGVRVTTIAPRIPHFDDDDSAVVRLPSLPLPTSTAYRLCVPYIRARDRVRVRDIDIVHTHSPFVTGWMGASYAKRRRVPLIFTYHTRIDEYAHYAPFDRATTRAAMLRLTRTFANAADTVIVPTAAMETRLRELGVDAPIAVVPSSIDVERFANGRRSSAVRALLGVHDASRIALIVSRLGKEKNVELAIDALAHTRDVYLAIVGDGPHRAALERRADACGARARVRFTGALPPDALPDIYASSDAFVFPSTSETQGLVLAEALAAGLPVVAIDLPGTRDVLAGCGRLCAPAVPAFAAAMEAAARAPREERFVAAAFDRFGTALQTRRVLDIYGELLKKNAIASSRVPYIWHSHRS